MSGAGPMGQSALGTALRYGLLNLLAVLVLLPFAGIVLAALHPAGAQVAGAALPDRWSWENFALAWEAGGFGDLMRSGLIISGAVVPLTVLPATTAGFALGVLKVRGGRALSLGFVLGLTVPVELLVIALYYNLREVGLTDSYTGVVMAEAALFLPFGVYWMQSHFSGVPRELVESARMDGAGNATVLWRVLMPLSGPAVTTLAVLVFMWSWNQFLLVLVMMQDPSMRTPPTGLGLFVGRYGTDVPLLAAASLIVIAPIVVVYLVFQRSFVEGVTRGAVKG